MLLRAGVSGRVRILEQPAPTAQAAADQIGCVVGAIANSFIFTTGDGEPLLVMTSGAHRVDTAPHAVFPLTYAELVQLTDATPMGVS